ncbi:hypothetical protein [Cupriavidus sp. a3]|uniref:hypothetical protein n=1 Tax=Cupriavidus sp. a3 TaxID=3242158 RepID=UPI003D9C0467
MQQSDSHVAVRMERPTLPFWGLLVALVAALSAYFGQREATNAALIEIKTEMVAMKKTIERMEGDRYTGADARRDFAWRDERVAEQGKRLAELENEVRARRR